MDSQFGHLLEIARIQSEVNRLFEVLLQTRGAECDGTRSWLPSVDICESADRVTVRCEVPGVSREALRITAMGSDLIISGEKAQGAPPESVKYHCVERANGTFRRVVHLPAMVNTRGAQAHLSHGLLIVTFPKVPNRRGEEVHIPVMEETVRVG